MRAKLRRGGAIALAVACPLLAVQAAFASSGFARVRYTQAVWNGGLTFFLRVGSRRLWTGG